MPARLRALPASTWWRAIPLALVAALAIGVPSDVIDTPLFGRPVPVRPVDVAILAVTAALIGLVFAIRAPLAGAADSTVGGAATEAGRTGAVWGGFVSFLAVGCPVCNQVVVALVGVSGALSWWAPVQPIVGLLAIGLLVVALRRRLATYDLLACPVPAGAAPGRPGPGHPTRGDGS